MSLMHRIAKIRRRVYYESIKSRLSETKDVVLPGKVAGYSHALTRDLAKAETA